MNASLWIRNHLTDRANAGLRRQVAALIPDGARVVEVGCANGRLLLDIAPRIERGFGIHLDARMIAYAERVAAQRGHRHLRFAAGDARHLRELLPFEPTVAVAFLILHQMARDDAVELLCQLAAVDAVLIADLVTPGSFLGRASLQLDEWMAGHLDR